MTDIATVTGEKSRYSIAGELTYHTVTQVFTTLENLNADKSNLIVDIKDVTHCDSAALALLLELRLHSDKQKFELDIQNAPAQLQALAAAHDLSALLI